MSCEECDIRKVILLVCLRFETYPSNLSCCPYAILSNSSIGATIKSAITLVRRNAVQAVAELNSVPEIMCIIIFCAYYNHHLTLNLDFYQCLFMILKTRARDCWLKTSLTCRNRSCTITCRPVRKPHTPRLLAYPHFILICNCLTKFLLGARVAHWPVCTHQTRSAQVQYLKICYVMKQTDHMIRKRSSCNLAPGFSSPRNFHLVSEHNTSWPDIIIVFV